MCHTQIFYDDEGFTNELKGFFRRENDKKLDVLLTFPNYYH